jgi:hypothetical protein
MTNPDPIWIILGASAVIAGLIILFAWAWRQKRGTTPLPIVLERLAEDEGRRRRGRPAAGRPA